MGNYIYPMAIDSSGSSLTPTSTDLSNNTKVETTNETPLVKVSIDVLPEIVPSHISLSETVQTEPIENKKEIDHVDEGKKESTEESKVKGEENNEKKGEEKVYVIFKNTEILGYVPSFERGKDECKNLTRVFVDNFHNSDSPSEGYRVFTEKVENSTCFKMVISCHNAFSLFMFDRIIETYSVEKVCAY